ncbi:MAG TPA: CBS domain-containing protein [Acetobacteraceae bacterium]
MKMSEVMTRHVEFIAPDALVREAAELMGELDVGALPVGGPDDLRGVVTDRDLLYRVVAEGRDASVVRVAEVLTNPAITCREDDEAQTALDLMAAHHIRRLAVRDAAGRVSGWVTLADLSRRLLLDNPSLQEALRALTETRPAKDRAPR